MFLLIFLFQKKFPTMLSLKRYNQQFQAGLASVSTNRLKGDEERRDTLRLRRLRLHYYILIDIFYSL